MKFLIPQCEIPQIVEGWCPLNSHLKVPTTDFHHFPKSCIISMSNTKRSIKQQNFKSEKYPGENEELTIGPGGPGSPLGPAGP